MKKLMTIVAAFWAAPLLAQTPAQTPASTPNVQISGSVTTGVQQFDNTTNSSKLTEYRDLRDNFYLSSLTFGAHNRQSGWFFDFGGANVGRNDQTLVLTAGRPGAWRFGVDWLEVPHNYSNKALTPYTQASAGVLEAPANVPITFKKLGTAAADVPGVLASDDLVAAFQRSYLTATPLETQTKTGRFALAWTGSDALAVAVAYNLRDKSGFKSAYGPIGDRPPRTLNIQLTEPVDYRTNDVTLSAEHDGETYQVRAEYLYSDFANGIDTLKWENVFATPAPGATYDAWDRSVSAYGVRPLPPDNRYHNATVIFGRNLPRESRLTATASYGRLEQNETLLPYSYNIDQVAVKTLPRATADALMHTANFSADYVVSPVRRLNVRVFYRRYDLNNETPSSRWQYVTSDTSNLNGTVTYVNKRVSVPYAWDRQNAGAEATWRLPRRSTLAFAFEREGIGRNHREADTTENIVRATWRTRAARWLSLEARFLQGLRDGGEYDYQVTREGYWYTLTEANDNNNPLFTFDNHPDMRRFDVADRLRRRYDFRINLTPRDIVAISAYVRRLTNDFESDVAPVQPLLDTTFADRAATTPGDQLGWLKNARTRYGIDLFVQPVSRLALNAFVNYDTGTSFERSIEFNENNKANPSAIATAELGPWTRAGSQWTADFDDRTLSTGMGAVVQVVPNRLSLTFDYALSHADFLIAYGGYGVRNWDGTPFAPTQQFAFAAPPDVREDLHTMSLRAEIPLKAVAIVAGYTYEKYELADWQQGSDAPWVEAVGADTLLRDSSRSFQWGNRLFNLGTYLAPGYSGHIGFVGFRYRF